jgi:hypothetical protein
MSSKHIAPSCTNESVKILLGFMTSDAIKRYLSEGYKYYVAVENNNIIGAIDMKYITYLCQSFTKLKAYQESFGK